MITNKMYLIYFNVFQLYDFFLSAHIIAIFSNVNMRNMNKMYGKIRCYKFFIRKKNKNDISETNSNLLL